jgi:hypothetical protein
MGVHCRAIWKLLYRGSDNSFSAVNFHSQCDLKGATVTLVRAENGRIVAAYNGDSWDCSESKDYLFFLKVCSGFSGNKDGFISSIGYEEYKKGGFNSDFQMTTFNIFRSVGEKGCDSHKAYGPTFGEGADLEISDNCNSNTKSYTNLGRSYKSVDGLPANELTLFGSKNFVVEEYEVYQIETEV